MGVRRALPGWVPRRQAGIRAPNRRDDHAGGSLHPILRRGGAVSRHTADGDLPPNETATSGSRYLGNDALWTELYPNPLRPRPEDVHTDGSIEIKVPWWRGVVGRLTVTGRRLDARAPPASAWIPTGYGRTGFQSTAVTFPTPGCWEVTGRAGDASLTFISLILEPA